jgi:hypothetical protein
MLIASFFVLGGDFWNKVRALFVRTAVVGAVAQGLSRPRQALHIRHV